MLGTRKIQLWVEGTLSGVVQFAHGGFLVAGVMVTLFAVAHAMMPDTVLQVTESVSGSKLSDLPGQTASAPLQTADHLSPHMKPLANYLARRYRVAESAIKPLLFTAQTAGDRAGIDPLLIVAVVAIESSFNPIAESSMGAQGLMQVIPRYHQDKMELTGVKSLLDPQGNIRIGTLVLKEYIRRSGSLEAGLAQYGGVVTDDGGQYASRVLSEKRRLESFLRRELVANVSGGEDLDL